MITKDQLYTDNSIKSIETENSTRSLSSMRIVVFGALFFWTIGLCLLVGTIRGTGYDHSIGQVTPEKMVLVLFHLLVEATLVCVCCRTSFLRLFQKFLHFIQKRWWLKLFGLCLLFFPWQFYIFGHAFHPVFKLNIFALILLAACTLLVSSRIRFYQITLSMCATIVTLFALEVIARFVVPSLMPQGNINCWRYDNTRGWSHIPNSVSSFSHQDFSTTVRINSDGLRDDEYSFDRVKGMKRMLVIGDSYGWGFGVEHDDIFCERLERKYQEWEIINASVAGYGTDQQYIYLLESGMQYQPDVVLLLYCWNDVVNNAAMEQYNRNKPMYSLIDEKLVLENSPVPPPHFMQLCDNLIYSHTYVLKLLYPPIRHQLLSGVKSAEPEADAGWDVTIQLLKRVSNLVETCGAKFVVVGMPHQPELDLKTREMFSTLKNHSQIYTLFLSDKYLEKKFRHAHDSHWNASGHEEVALDLEKFLLDSGIFP